MWLFYLGPTQSLDDIPYWCICMFTQFSTNQNNNNSSTIDKNAKITQQQIYAAKEKRYKQLGLAIRIRDPESAQFLGQFWNPDPESVF